MKTTESSPGKADGAKERDRALERTLRDALALAASKRVADQALRQARNKAHDAGRRDLRRVASHLAGYGTLLTYIVWHQRRTRNSPPDKPEGLYQRHRSWCRAMGRKPASLRQPCGGRWTRKKCEGNPLAEGCGKVEGI